MWGGFILSPARFSHYQDNTTNNKKRAYKQKKDTLWTNKTLIFTPKVK